MKKTTLQETKKERKQEIKNRYERWYKIINEKMNKDYRYFYFLIDIKHKLFRNEIKELIKLNKT